MALFLAYRAGAFPDVEKGLDKDGFAEAAIAHLVALDDAIMLESGRPVGFVQVRMWGGHALLGIDWFPWASPRNKIECALKFFLEYRDKAHLIWASEDTRFFSHIGRYGVIRAIGLSKGWGDEPMTLYEALK